MELDMDHITECRRQIISEFCGMKIDMDYLLCMPSVHAIIGNNSVIMGYSGRICGMEGSFPEEKLCILKEWVLCHEEEIIANHLRCGKLNFPLEPIQPFEP